MFWVVFEGDESPNVLTKMNMSDSKESDQLEPRVLDKCLYVKVERVQENVIES